MEKPYNLEARTYLFAKNCRLYIQSLSKNISNIEDGKQLVRSSGSVGANYIEANEKLEEIRCQIPIKNLEKRNSKNLNSGWPNPTITHKSI